MADAKKTLTNEEALAALNQLRNNMVGTQKAGWSSLSYPLAAILNAAGMKYEDPTPVQMREHIGCYGGAGGFPGHALHTPIDFMPGVSRLEGLARAIRRYFDNPTDENKHIVELRMKDVKV